jgi:uncharacterized protein
MGQVRYRFHKELNDFIAPALRNIEITRDLNRKTSVKDVIESFGVPHTEVALILLNGVPKDFTYIVQDGDAIGVYPSSECVDIKQILRLRPEPLAIPRFVIDANLGRLARYLRLLGFDCLYRNDYSDDMVAKISSESERIVLTRDRSLLQRKIIIYGYFVRASTPKIQVKEVLKRYNLFHLIAPLVRCTRCNGILKKTEKQKIEHRLEPLTKQYYHDFLICMTCRQIYWQGSHYERAMHLVDEFKENDK